MVGDSKRESFSRRFTLVIFHNWQFVGWTPECAIATGVGFYLVAISWLDFAVDPTPATSTLSRFLFSRLLAQKIRPRTFNTFSSSFHYRYTHPVI